MKMKTKRRHKHIKLLKVTKHEIEMFEVEYYRRYNYRLNTIIAR
jgi:hypothetical protein